MRRIQAWRRALAAPVARRSLWPGIAAGVAVCVGVAGALQYAATAPPEKQEISQTVTLLAHLAPSTPVPQPEPVMPDRQEELMPEAPPPEWTRPEPSLALSALEDPPPAALPPQIAERATPEEDVPPPLDPPSLGTAAPLPSPDPARSNYWSLVHSTIRSELRYPRTAMARGLQGRVIVELEIGRDGSLEGVSTTDATSPFARAALRAVQRAAPFPEPPQALNPPLQKAIPIRFQLSPE